MLSGQVSLYQTVSVPLLEAVKVCAIVLSPLVVVVEMVLVPEPPCVAATVVGLALMEKSLLAVAPQPESLKVATWVSQLKVPLEGMYSVVYQKVQSSLGSIVRFE